MSHFSCLVIGEDPEEQLAPFQENNNGDCPEEYMEFHDVEDEYREEYETEMGNEFYCSSNSSWGQNISKENYEQIKDLPVGEEAVLTLSRGATTTYFTLGKKYKAYFNAEHKYPEGLHQWIECVEIIETDHPDKDVCFRGKIRVKRIDSPKELPMKELYPDFETFIKDWAGYKKRDEKTGRYGYYENPNRKWDWYELGGRWTGFFKAISPNAGSIGKPGLMTKSPKEGYIDQGTKSMIDFEGMRKDARQKAIEDYRSLAESLGGEIKQPEHTWAEVLKMTDIDLDNKRELFNNQPEVIAFKKIKTHFYDDIEDYNCTEKEYGERAANSSYVPFSIIVNGKWYEKGSMGWWGMVADEKDQDIWNKKVVELIESCSNNTLFSLYDLHI